MNGKLAFLIAERSKASLDDRADYDFRLLARDIFPMISSAAHRGVTQTSIKGLLNDEVCARLRKLNYVIRHERAFQMTSVEWCNQMIMDDDGHIVKITPEEYNRKWQEYEAVRPLIM